MAADTMTTLMAAWPFASTAMLWWGLAAGVPLLIHLLSRRRYQETSWAAMQFLLAAVRKHARRIRIEQLLVLLLRMALLILLALALADPLSSSRSHVFSKDESPSTHWILVMDVSYSMNYQVEGHTLLELAREAASRVVREARQGDGFTLVLLADPSVALIRDPAFDADDVLREIDTITARDGGADLNGALEIVRQLTEPSSRRSARLAQTRICFFTDLGRTTWDALETPATRRRLADLAASASLHVVEVGNASWSNAGITRLDLVDPLVTPDRPARLVAEIRRWSPDAPRHGRAQWLVDGNVVHEEDVDLTSGSETLAITQRLTGTGDHAVELRLVDTDQLDTDNHRYRAVVVRDAMRVLCVQGREGEARYVALALEPRQTDKPLTRWEVASQTALLTEPLEKYQMIFLCNVGRFRREEVTALRQYVRQGGCVCFFLGDLVQPANYNELMGPQAGPDRLLPAHLGEVIEGPPRQFDPLEYRHPLIAPFRAHERSGLLTVPTYKYVRLEPVADADVHVALALDNGEPILLEEKVGAGRVFLFGSSAAPPTGAGEQNRVWSEFATWPSFPPVIHEMLALAVQGVDQQREARVGEILSGEVPDGPSSAPLLMHPPRGEPERISMRSEVLANGHAVWSYERTLWSGMYRVAPSGDSHPGHLYAVNVDPREGVLDRVDSTALPTQLQVGVQAAEEVTAQDGGSATRSMASGFLAVCFGLVLLESFLAYWFGSARA